MIDIFESINDSAGCAEVFTPSLHVAKKDIFFS